MVANQSANPTRRRHNPAPFLPSPGQPEVRKSQRLAPLLRSQETKLQQKGNKTNNSSSSDWSAVGPHVPPRLSLPIGRIRCCGAGPEGQNAVAGGGGKRRMKTVKLGQCQPGILELGLWHALMWETEWLHTNIYKTNKNWKTMSSSPVFFCDNL